VIQRDSTHDLGGRCSWRKRDVLAGLNEFGGCPTDATLFVGEVRDLGLEGSIISEWLIEKRFDRLGSAVSSTKQAALFQDVQVASNRHYRNIKFFTQLIDGDDARLLQDFLDDDEAIFLLIARCGLSAFGFHEP
jgi:hypothetical protein